MALRPIPGLVPTFLERCGGACACYSFAMSLDAILEVHCSLTVAEPTQEILVVLPCLGQIV